MITKQEDLGTMNTEALYQTDFPLPGRRQGKVRDIYAIEGTADASGQVLIIATDRISAFDVVLPTPVAGKGRLLTQISASWFDLVRSWGIIEDHLISTDPADIPGLSDEQRQSLIERVMVCRPAKVVPVECVVRGYIAGSGWSQYSQDGTICGIKLPDGLKRAERLPEPIFTPTTKADTGHDEPMSFDEVCSTLSQTLAERLRDISLQIYKQAAEYALERGLILADTKLEFGFALDDMGKPSDELILIDEIFTPDSSRYWPADSYEPGVEPFSFDKQYVRNYLQELVDAGKWDKTPPGPELTPFVVENTLKRYAQVKSKLFG